MITQTESGFKSICSKCKGCGFILEWKDDRLMNPSIWKIDNIEEVKRDKTIDKLNGRMFDEEGNEFLTDTTKFIMLGRPEYAVQYAVPCPECKGVSRSKEDNRDTKMPNEYRGFNYSSFDWSIYKTDTSNKQKMVEYYIDNYPKMKEQMVGLYITSKTKGSGKTYLACVIVNSIMAKHKVNAKFITMLDYLKALELNRQYGNHDYTDAYYQVELLIIDDFSQAKKSETINKAFYSLIDYRQKHHQPTIFTSNDRVSDLQYDERIVSRIDAHSIDVLMPEEDIRRLNAKYKLSKIMADAGIGGGDANKK